MPDDFGISKTPVLQVDPLAKQIPQGASPTLRDFAAKVKQTASKMPQTGPFQGKVAIGHLYDQFYKDFPRSKESLGVFKHRLVNAAKARLLSLHRLDSPDMMDRALRDKSEAPWGNDTVHFIGLDLENRLKDVPL